MKNGETWGYAFVIHSTNRFILPICIEFDLVKLVDSPRIRFNGDNSSYAYVLTTTGHYKISILNESATLKIDDNAPFHLYSLESLAKSNGVGVYWELDTDTDKLNYKNFMIYSI